MAAKVITVHLKQFRRTINPLSNCVEIVIPVVRIDYSVVNMMYFDICFLLSIML